MGSFYAIIGLHFVYGLCTSINLTIGFIYMNDFVPAKHHITLGTVWLCWQGVYSLLIAIYFRYIDPHKDWRWLFSFVYGFGFALCFLIQTLLPESPKWYYDKK